MNKTELEVTMDNNETKLKTNRPKVTGIGGIFFQSPNPKAIKAWYGKHLGLAIDDFGSPFEFRNANRPEERNYLRWSPHEENSEYYHPSNKNFMINYRVQNLEGLVAQLKKNGVKLVDEIQTYEYGKFVHLMDPDGTKVELWEPVDRFFDQMDLPTTK